MASKSKRKNNHSLSMSYALHKMTLWTAGIFLFEAVAIAVVALFYFFDFPKGFHEMVKPEYWIFITVGIFVIDFFVVWVTEVKLSHIRRKSDLDASSIIGSDVQEAYNFGQIGLVVTDENDLVLWTNNLFKERQIDLLDANILEWQPKLAELKNAPVDMSEKIEANGRDYSVKYLPEARLYIFKDSTDYEQVSEYNRQQATCVGIIMIDNYSDVAGKIEDDSNDLITKVRAAIFDYAKTMGVLVRRIRNDSYFAVCNFTSLDRMEQDGFTVLSNVRMLGKGQQVIPTLSIGFAHRFDDITKLSEMASNAIDIANSRGGDQAVVSHYGEELKYYGGKTAAVENTGRVQFRSIANSLIGLAKDASNIYISGHKDMDMDAMGACLGVAAICEHYKKPYKIIFDPRLTEKKTRLAFQSTFDKARLDRMTITPKEAEESIRPSTLFVVVDVSVPTLVMGDKALEKSSKTIVIDHHRRGEAFIEKPVLSYIDPSAGSTSEIIAEFVKYSSANPRIEIPAEYATIMLSGIFLDTSFFKSKATGVRSFEACEILKEFGADNAKADDFLKDEVEEYNLVTKIASTMRSPYTGVAYCVSDDSDIIEKSALAKVANQIRELKGVNASFVIGRIKQNEIAISARSDGSINVQLLMEKLGGGGHFGMAAASFPGSTVAVVENKLLDALATYLDEAKTDLGGLR